MSWQVTVTCDRCGTASECEARSKLPDKWQEYEVWLKDTYNLSYWTFCEDCTIKYQKLLQREAEYQRKEITNFFDMGVKNDKPYTPLRPWPEDFDRLDFMSFQKGEPDES